MHPSSIVIVDGYEQLSRWNRWRLQWLCRRRGWGLIVSSHRDTGLPDLLRVSVDLDRAERDCPPPARHGTCLDRRRRTARCFTRHRGDLREMLMELYDVYEERKRI